MSLRRESQQGLPMMFADLMDDSIDEPVRLTVFGQRLVLMLSSGARFQQVLHIQGMRCNDYKGKISLVGNWRDDFQLRPGNEEAVKLTPPVPTTLLGMPRGSGTVSVIVRVLNQEDGQLECRDTSGFVSVIGLLKGAEQHVFVKDTPYCLHRLYVSDSGKMLMYPSGGAEEITEDEYESMTAAALEQGAGTGAASSQRRAA